MADQVGQHVDFGLVYQGAREYARTGSFVTESSGGPVLAYVNRVYDQVLPGDVAWVTLGSADAAGAFYNRVYDQVLPGDVAWVTLGSADAAGAFYPGPGVFGVSTSNYTLESVLDSTLL